jgi:hypothetical protein
VNFQNPPDESVGLNVCGACGVGVGAAVRPGTLLGKALSYQSFTSALSTGFTGEDGGTYTMSCTRFTPLIGERSW